MRILSHNPLARLLKTGRKQSSNQVKIPFSAQRALDKSNQPRPFNINRDDHGTRPWHSYIAKKTNR
jgi:hypothetical protein